MQRFRENQLLAFVDVGVGNGNSSVFCFRERKGKRKKLNYNIIDNVCFQYLISIQNFKNNEEKFI